MRGYALKQEDIIRRDVINEIMCNGFLDFQQIADLHQITLDEIKQLTAYRKDNFNEFIDDNLLTIEDDRISLKPAGFLAVRNIAMKLDPLLSVGKNQYSKTV